MTHCRPNHRARSHRTINQRAANLRSKNRRAFTLVEMLVVVGIIAILVAILVPTIAGAVRRAKVAAIVLEINQMDQAVVAYEQDHGDRPPDFSDATVVQRHLDNSYGRIDQAERTFVLNLVGVVDPAEALVFWLGGLSDNERRPFTGDGGPVFWDDDGDGVVQIPDEISYNTSRNQGYFDFQQQRLSLSEVGTGTIRYYSTDETQLHGKVLSGVPGDAFPVFSPKNRSEPYVYFDSRTYMIVDGSSVPIQTYPSVRTGDYTTTTLVDGVARPYVTTDRDPNHFDDSMYDIRARYFAKRRDFQIISASLDGDYGADLFPPSSSIPAFKIFDTGESYHPTSPPWAGWSDVGYQDGDLDNVTNFSEGTLEDKLQ